MIDPTENDIGRNVVVAASYPHGKPFDYAKIVRIGDGRLAGYVVVMTDKGDTMNFMTRDLDWKEASQNPRMPTSEFLTRALIARIRTLETALRELADAADDVGVRHFDTDTMSPEVKAMQAATLRARAALEGSGK